MSGLEPAGLALGAIGILFQTFEVAYQSFRLIQGVKGHEEKYSLVWAAFENQREIFFIWGEKQGLTQKYSRTDPTPERKLRQRFGDRRCDRIAHTLAEMAKLFKEAEKTNNKYGLRKVKVEKKMLWTLHKEDEFEVLVKKLRNFNADLEKFTAEEAPRKPLSIDTKIAGDDLISTRKVRFAIHDFDDLFTHCSYFGDPNITLYLKLQTNRFKIDENPSQKLPEWLEYQLRLRPETIKFNLTILPSSDALSNGSKPPQRPIRLLVESGQTPSGPSLTTDSTKQIATLLHHLTRCTTGCPLCSSLLTTILSPHSPGLTLGSFRGLYKELPHIIYHLPTPQPPTFIPLSSFLPGGSHSHLFPPSGPNPAKRIRLIQTLTLTFLQLLETSWSPSLSPTSIYFLVRPDLTPSLTEPYLARPPAAGSKQAPSITSKYASRQSSTQSYTSSKSHTSYTSAFSAKSQTSSKSHTSYTSHTSLYSEPQSSTFNDTTFSLALLIYEILTWLPAPRRHATTAAIRRARTTIYFSAPPSYSESVPTTPSYTAHPPPPAPPTPTQPHYDPQAQFSTWLQKEGVLREVKKVVASPRYVTAVRRCFLGGFVAEDAEDADAEEGEDAGVRRFWEDVVAGLVGRM